MKKNLLKFVNSQDLKTFGLIPELLGRLPVVTHLEPLDADTLRDILTEPKNALMKQYKKLFELEGIELIVENEVYNYMVEKAVEYKLGARGLRSILRAYLLMPCMSFRHHPKNRLHLHGIMQNANSAKARWGW
ncbi:hypothetical protein LWM68_02240 [Niabella sp. W65]|nr:hypothetical protein [Niabella sp. W65]MCH7361703.1 hypothetical protein [Niabella sp. W65]ULT45474.1 hypothetical protein KRR40_20750 [Niabella sp. I65]